MTNSYEEQRLANIRANQKILQQLGLPFANIDEKVVHKKKIRKNKKIITKTDHLYQLRNRADLKEEDLLELEDNWDIEPLSPIIKPKKRQKVNKNKRTSNTNPKSSKNVKSIIPYTAIGHSIDLTGYSRAKDPVMLLLNSSNFVPKFSNMCGIQQFSNSIVLFINIGGKEYENVFYPSVKGTRMCIKWFASRSQTEETPVIQRIIVNVGKIYKSVFIFCKFSPLFINSCNNPIKSNNSWM